jgi:hypothetical protein
MAALILASSRCQETYLEPSGEGLGGSLSFARASLNSLTASVSAFLRSESCRLRELMQAILSPQDVADLRLASHYFTGTRST